MQGIFQIAHIACMRNQPQSVRMRGLPDCIQNLRIGPPRPAAERARIEHLFNSIYAGLFEVIHGLPRIRRRFRRTRQTYNEHFRAQLLPAVDVFAYREHPIGGRAHASRTAVTPL